jgi:hypothetical protein
MSDEKTRLRWINLGELIALAALIVSGLGVWIAWKNNNEDKTARIVAQNSAVPLALRGTVDSEGRLITLVPADASHALESATVAIKGASPIEVGSDGRLAASDVEAALNGREKERKDVTHSVSVRIAARYVEAGADRHGGGSYVLRYKWEGGRLFGGRSLRLVGLTKA